MSRLFRANPGSRRHEAITISGRRSLTHAALQTIDGDHDGGTLEHLYQPVKQAFVVMVSGLEIFVQDALGITNRSNSQFLVTHLIETSANNSGT
jgi:hypothetical protein